MRLTSGELVASAIGIICLLAGSAIFGVTGSFAAFVLVGAAILILGALVLRVQSRADAARRGLLAVFAAKSGFDYFPFGSTRRRHSAARGGQGAREFITMFNGIGMLAMGDSREVRDVLVSRRESGDWYFFEFSYTIQHDKGRTTYPFFVGIVRLPLYFLELAIRPEGMLDRIGNAFTRSDVQFESEEFNRRYFVTCPDAKFAHDVLHPQAIELMLRMPDRQWYANSFFIMAAEEHGVTPPKVLRLLADMEAFVQLLPDYVKQDYGAPANWPSPLET